MAHDRITHYDDGRRIGDLPCGNTIGGKISPVCDRLCDLCPQCFGGECRAYEQPHSSAERAQRLADPVAFCRTAWGSGSAFALTRCGIGHTSE